MLTCLWARLSSRGEADYSQHLPRLLWHFSLSRREHELHIYNSIYVIEYETFHKDYDDLLDAFSVLSYCSSYLTVAANTHTTCLCTSLLSVILPLILRMIDLMVVSATSCRPLPYRKHAKKVRFAWRTTPKVLLLLPSSAGPFPTPTPGLRLDIINLTSAELFQEITQALT